MLNRGNNYFLFFIFYFLFFISCNDGKKIQKQRELYFAESTKVIGIDEYYRVYDQANDSINIWVKNNIDGYKMQKYSLEWKIDSLICFNKEVNKCIMSIMNQESETVNNSINYFYGIKINEHWYFFRGPTLYTFSENYDLPPATPLSFEKLKEIATTHIYRGYLKKGKKGQWEINEDFFHDLTSVAWCTDCVTQEDWDRTYLSIIRENWQRRDTTNQE
jgi:hypothetical protein